MTEIDYSKLSRHQKLAIFMIVIGPDAAADVLKQFGDADAELLCKEMSAFTIIPASVQRQAIEEFSTVVAQSAGSALGGLNYAHRTLEIAKGDFKASAIIGRVAPSGPPADIVKDISEMEGRQIFNLVKQEQPQTIAFVLSYLDTAKSAEVFGLLTTEMREDVAERLGTIESTSLNLAGKVSRSLGRHFDIKARPAFHNSGGVRVAADLIKLLDKDASKSLLARLEERNPPLSAAIRKKLFRFEDVNRLQASDLQRVLREVDSANLALAMKAASDGLRGKIYGAISKRAAEGLKDEIELLGSVRMKDVEAAQDAIIQVVRRLEEEGQISFEADSAQNLVA
jgi:flagellar motor switch protein FliG